MLYFRHCMCSTLIGNTKISPFAEWWNDSISDVFDNDKNVDNGNEYDNNDDDKDHSDSQKSNYNDQDNDTTAAATDSDDDN